MYITNVSDYDNLISCNCTNKDNNDNNTIIHNNSLQLVTYLFNIFDGVHINQTFIQ